MRHALLAAALVGLLPNLAGALELKNVRPAYGPLGATRENLKVLPGDVVFIAYDIEGLTVDPKTGKASFVTSLELIDPNMKSLFKKETPAEVVPQLGGNRMPGDLTVEMGSKPAVGKYSVRLGVTDRLAKETKAFEYPFEVVADTFGFVYVEAQTVGTPGQTYVAKFALVNMGLDAKKQPNTEVAMRVLDDAGKVVTPPTYIFLPKDLPDSTDWQKYNLAPVQYPIYLNRPGRFTIEIAAQDKIGQRQVSLRYPLTVIDIPALAGRAH